MPATHCRATTLLCAILLPSCSGLFSLDLSVSTCRQSATFMWNLALLTRRAQQLSSLVSCGASTQRHRLPITTPLLREICRHVAVPRMRHPHDKAMLRAAFSLAFHGFFRCGELTAGLRRCDVTISTDQRSLSVNVRSSKTDPDSTGHTVLVGASTDALICPVQAMANYLAFRPGGDHLFTYANGQPLTRNAVSSELRNLLPLCGVTDPSAYASHSFRIGAATSAAMAGVPEHIIRIMGRWRSDAVHRYIRAATADTLRVSRQLAAVQSHQW
eukprot:scpid54702/ scgid32372/ 